MERYVRGDLSRDTYFSLDKFKPIQELKRSDEVLGKNHVNYISKI